MADENINLAVTATTADAQKNLTSLVGALGDLGGAFNNTQQQVKKAEGGSAGFLDVLKSYYQNASMGAKGLEGFVNVIGSINPVAGAAAGGILKLIGSLGSLKQEALAALNQAQGLTINLESLAAQEMVKAGQFSNATEAMGVAKVAAQGLLREVQKIGLVSPFENATVVQTFQQGMAFGFTAEQSLKLTRASLDMAAGLGKSGVEMSMIGMVMGQIRSTGKIFTQDLNQLRMRGINLADMLQRQLGVSIEQFNAGLQTGKYSMDDLLTVFTDFANTNFAGAGARMARTFQGIKSTLSDLAQTSYITLFKDSFDQVTAVLADGLGILVDFVTQSGVLEKVGARLSSFTGKVTTFLNQGLNIARYLIAVITDGDYLNDWLTHLPAGLQGAFQSLGKFVADLQPAFQTAQMWIGMIGANLRQIGDAIWQFVKPAFDWLTAGISGFDWSPILTHIMDTVNTIGQVIYDLVEMIRRILTGNADNAFQPLRHAITYVLTWLILTWDRFGADAVNWGWNLVVQIANGIVAAAKSVLQAAMNFLGNMIGLFIKPGSPPKKGPLSHIVEWGKGLINTYVQSFKTADFGLLKDSLQPIQAALQDAVQAGTISEVEMPEIFKAVREDVAALIADFRKTGVIGEEALGRIGARLGEGGAELTKYLRLQLQFQKAQDNLAKVSEEVAAAEKAGFVPQALAQKLKAAQAAAGQAQDELAWQKEYLGLQQDSVDIQLQMVKAMEKLAAAMDKAGGGEKAGKAAGGAGAATPTVAPFTSNLMEMFGGAGGAGALTDITEGAMQLQQAFSGVSDEFLLAKQKAEGLVGQAERFLGLPLVAKLREIAKALGFGSQFQFIETFLRLPIATKISYLKNKLEELTGIDFDKVLAFFDPEKLKQKVMDFFTGLPAQISTMLNTAFTTLVAEFPTLVRKLWAGVMNLVRLFMGWLQQNGPQIGMMIGRVAGQIGGFLFNLLTVEIPLFLPKIIGAAYMLLMYVDNWLRTEGPGIAASWWAGLLAMIDVVWGTLKNEGPKWVVALIDFIGAFVVGFVAGFAENGPEWYAGLWEAGAKFVQSLKDAITGAWDMVTDTRQRVLAWINNVVLLFGIWIYRIKELGGTFVQKIKDGISAAWDFLDWIKGQFITLVDNLVAGAGETLASVTKVGAEFVRQIKAGFEAEWDSIENMGFGAWIVSKISGAVTGIGGAVAGWADSMYTAGEDLIQGMIDGIRAAARNLLSAFIDLMGQLPDWAKKLLGISSPSTIFRGYGQNIVQGLALGLQDMQGRLATAFQGVMGVVKMSDVGNMLTGQMSALRIATAGANLGLNLTQSYTFGDLQFPNVRDGRDATGLERQLSQITLRGQMVAKTSGGQ